MIAIKKLYEVLEERRKHHRIYVLVPVDVCPVGGEGKFLKGIIHNISSGGVGIICDKAMHINDVAVMNFKLPGNTSLEDVQAGVVRVEKIGDKFNLGMLFMNMLEKQKIIDDFIYNIKKKRYSDNTLDISSFVV
jgi:c-di-GMP-binding flagellar brake protein YcgR